MVFTIPEKVHFKLTEIVSREKYLTSEVVVDKITSQEGSSQVSEDMTKVLVLDPSQPVKTKGRTRNFLRFQSRKEVAQQEKERVKRQRTCKHCRENGHYKIACPKLKDSLP